MKTQGNIIMHTAHQIKQKNLQHPAQIHAFNILSKIIFYISRVFLYNS